MSALQPDAVMRTWFEEVWNQGREDSIDKLFSATATAHGLPGGPTQGPGAFRAVFKLFRGAFPDLHIDVEKTVVEGDFVTVMCRVTGTHTGPTLGFPPTGRHIDFNGMVLARVTNGQFQEGWNCFDFLTMYQQLGIVPPAPGA